MFKKNQTPIFINKVNQNKVIRQSYHHKCAKKELYYFILQKVQLDENIIDLSRYRTTTRAIWPKKPKLRVLSYNSTWYYNNYNDHEMNDINLFVRRLEYLIQQQIYVTNI